VKFEIRFGKYPKNLFILTLVLIYLNKNKLQIVDEDSFIMKMIMPEIYRDKNKLH